MTASAVISDNQLDRNLGSLYTTSWSRKSEEMRASCRLWFNALFPALSEPLGRATNAAASRDARAAVRFSAQASHHRLQVSPSAALNKATYRISIMPDPMATRELPHFRDDT
jgi:hypothetical protein